MNFETAGAGFPPPPWMLLTEPLRSAMDFAALGAAAPWLAGAPMGDGHPVLVLPGLFADNGYTAPLSAFLRTRGYATEAFGRDRNWGDWATLDEVVLPTLRRLNEQHGRKVSIVGCSMGGLFAREAARREPDRVRCIVTMGSAASGPSKANYVWPVYALVTGQPAESLVVPPAPVPSTSVYSRLDGLNDWRTCRLPETPVSENVEIHSSHLGLIHHPASCWVVADRLAQPEGQWSHFAPPAWAAWPTRGFRRPAGPFSR
jgi:pimeloyl-ACP methyl ester carboxylesterase